MATPDVDSIKELIRWTFAATERPPNGSLHASEQSDEASTLLEADFADKGDWQGLEASFIDQAPAGFGSALSFFTAEAFGYFLPAYLVADLDGQLDQANPVFHLTHGLTDADRARNEAANDGAEPIATSHDLDRFTPDQARAIVAYLEHQAAVDHCQRDQIEQALRRYWWPRTT